MANSSSGNFQHFDNPVFVTEPASSNDTASGSTNDPVDGNEAAQRGLTNSEALSILCHQLETNVVQWYRRQDNESTWQVSSLHARIGRLYRQQAAQTGAVIILVISTVLLAIAAGTADNKVALIVQTVVLCCMAILNIIYNSFRCRRRNVEVLAKVTSLISWVKSVTALGKSDCPGLSRACSWMKLNVVVRGQRKLLLPTAVLVPGDLIVMVPDQAVPCACQLISPKAQRIYLNAGGKVPWGDWADERDQVPSPVYLEVQECMAVQALRDSLSQCTERTSPLEQQVNTIAQLMWTIVLPAVFAVSFIMQLIFWQAVSGKGNKNWSLLLLAIPVYSILALLPLTFSWLWEATVMYFTSAMLMPVHKLRRPQRQEDWSWRHGLHLWLKLCFGEAPEYLPRSSRILFNLSRVTTLCCVDKVGVLSNPTAVPSQIFFFGPSDVERDIQTSPSAGESDKLHVQTPSTSFNGVHPAEVASNITITTQPLSTPLSVCSEMRRPSRSMTLDGVGAGSSHHIDQLQPDTAAELRRRSGSLPVDLSVIGTGPLSCSTPVANVAETAPPGKPFVLDLSYRFEENSLEFDDVNWEEHQQSLNPLGLNALVNHEYSVADQLSDGPSLATLLSNLSSTHIIGKECMCKLGLRIGFDPGTLVHYDKQRRIVMSAAREVHTPVYPAPGMYRSSSVLSSSPSPPVLQIVSMLVSAGGSLQLLTQGSGDLVLEACTDYYTGQDICPLAVEQKKSIQEFITRHSSQTHCVAFAYRPLPKQINSCLQQKEKTAVMHLANNQLLFPQPIDTMSAYSVAISESGHRPQSLSSYVSGPSPMSSLVSGPSPIAAYQHMLSEQIFMGMVALQYLPKDDAIRLVDDAKAGGIRFVRFSSESELRSRVFSSRLGIETGWNCHISLKPRGDTASRSSHNSAFPPSLSASSVGASATVPTAVLSRSGGGSAGVIEEESLADLDGNGSLARVRITHTSTADTSVPIATGVPRVMSQTGSHMSVDSLEVDFNETARLPRGIAEIRPHLDNVDNVPLQVPLFTDCQPDAICEMISIMQERGEIVCCMGSSLDFHNTQAFLQADVGVAIEPEVPANTCPDHSLQPNVEDTGVESVWLQLATRLCSLPCSIVFHRNDPIRLITLFGRARSSIHAIGQYFLFLAGGFVSISLLLMLANMFFLPPPLSGLHVMWIVVVVLPLASSGILAAPADPKLMTIIPSRATQYKLSRRKVILHYAGRVFPLTAAVLVCFGVILTSFCKHLVGVGNGDNSTVCHPLLGDRAAQVDGPWNYSPRHIALAQEITAFVFIFFFGIVSITFYQRTLPLTSYLREISWKCYAVIVASLAAQVLYSLASVYIWFSSLSEAMTLISSVEVAVWILLVACPCVMILINELVKRSEHRLLCREQRSAKLIFETKLGMNSPI